MSEKIEKPDVKKRRTTRSVDDDALQDGLALPPGAQASPESSQDGRVVLQIRVRPELRREIKRHADEAGVTCQTFVLEALREQGVNVTNEDLFDLRKGEHRPLRNGAKRQDLRARGIDPVRALMDRVAGSEAGSAGANGSSCCAPAGGLTLVINNYVAERAEALERGRPPAVRNHRSITRRPTASRTRSRKPRS